MDERSCLSCEFRNREMSDEPCRSCDEETFDQWEQVDDEGEEV